MPLSTAIGDWVDRLKGRWQDAYFGTLALLVVGGVLAVGLNASDVALYQHYAKAALTSPALHSLPREYPALSLAVFLMPEAFPYGYAAVFALLAGIAAVGLVLSSDGLIEHPGWSRRTVLYLVLGVAAVVFARYDVFPVLAAVFAVEGARKGRWGRAWGWAVLGGLLKIFPFLLLPGFLVVERAQTGKWALRRALAASMPVAVVLVVQSFLAPGSVLSPVRYELRRGFELSSLQGSLAFLTDPLHARWVNGFGSVEVVGHGRIVIGALVLGTAAMALASIWRFASNGRLSVEAVSLAALSVAVLADKAFAAQYLIWLVPFWAYWPLRRGWVAAALLTTSVYPVFYAEAHTLGPSFYLATAAGAVRNTVLMVATARWLMGELKRQRQPGYQGRGQRANDSEVDVEHASVVARQRLDPSECETKPLRKGVDVTVCLSSSERDELACPALMGRCAIGREGKDALR